mmetsp:Transcript_12727/g.31253  ORF Transcript_12727/g.31253 Transcript_12727/m.31253 type:complete len:208 (+) Transcript_12727:84-707(+)
MSSGHRRSALPEPVAARDIEAERAAAAAAAARRPQWFPIHASERRRAPGAPSGGTKSMTPYEQLKAFILDHAAGDDGWDSETENAPAGGLNVLMGAEKGSDDQQRAFSVCSVFDGMDFGSVTCPSSLAKGLDGPKAIPSPPKALCPEDGAAFVPCKKCRTGPETKVATGCFTPTGLQAGEGGEVVAERHRPYLRQLSGSEFEVHDDA